MKETIVTLTMNPAVDLCTSVTRLAPFHKLRCGEVRHDAGGGGINVARAARRLGGDPVAIFPVGGPMGQLLERLVGAEGVRYVSIPISGDTREDITVDEVGTGAQYRFVLPGPTLSAAESRTCLEKISEAISASTWLVASGSLPPGVPASFYAELGRLAAPKGAKCVLDSSGPGLKAAIGNGVYLIKPSLREFEELVGSALPNDAACLAAARRIIANGGATLVALTLGENGALLVGDNFAMSASAPKLKPVSTVGAGDSFLGALVVSLAGGESNSDALCIAVAAGAAALLSRGTDLCHAADVERLAREIEVRQL